MTGSRDITWVGFIDGAAARARLLSPPRQAEALLAALHLVDAVWGDIVLLRAASRLVQQHHFTLESLLRAEETAEAKAWLAGVLTSRFEDFAERRTPLPSAAMKPAWSLETERL